MRGAFGKPLGTVARVNIGQDGLSKQQLDKEYFWDPMRRLFCSKHTANCSSQMNVTKCLSNVQKLPNISLLLFKRLAREGHPMGIEGERRS